METLLVALQLASLIVVVPSIVYYVFGKKVHIHYDAKKIKQLSLINAQLRANSDFTNKAVDNMNYYQERYREAQTENNRLKGKLRGLKDENNRLKEKIKCFIKAIKLVKAKEASKGSPFETYA